MNSEYVMGFLFSPDWQEVVLMQELGSQQWSGVGGAVESSERSMTAMERVFVEKAGLWLPGWQVFANLQGMGRKGHCFRVKSSEWQKVKSMMNEEIGVFSVNSLPPNLGSRSKWLIPLSLDKRLMGVQQIWCDL